MSIAVLRYQENSIYINEQNLCEYQTKQYSPDDASIKV